MLPGAFDTIIYGSGWNPDEEVRFRLLRPGGIQPPDLDLGMTKANSAGALSIKVGIFGAVINTYGLFTVVATGVDGAQASTIIIVNPPVTPTGGPGPS